MMESGTAAGWTQGGTEGLFEEQRVQKYDRGGLVEHRGQVPLSWPQLVPPNAVSLVMSA